MDTDTLRQTVERSLDALVEAAELWGGLFPSMLDRETGRMLREAPPAIDGQRDGDRALLGSNLMHDHVVLRLMYDLAEAGIRPDFRQAADRYLRFFAEQCTDTVSGLFPWGEHSFWQLVDGQVGSGHRPGEPEHAIHDHLRQAPIWLWERLWRLNPTCVERFAEGLDNHWTEGEPLEYIRHAYIMRRCRYPRGARSCDFPRHGGFYMLDWCFAWLRTGREDFRDQVLVMLDYWWEKRLDTGLLLVESRTKGEDDMFSGIGSPSQTISLAVSLLDTAEMIADRDGALADIMGHRAQVYLQGFLSAPHRPDEDLFLNTFDLETGDADRPMACWGSRYGAAAAADRGLLCLRAHEMTGDGRLMDWARSVGDWYSRTPFPDDIAVPAADAGHALELLSALYDREGDERWLEAGVRLAGELSDIYCDAPLPRAAAGVDYYESQTGPGYLLHGLARIALLAETGGSCPVAIDYTSR